MFSLLSSLRLFFIHVDRNISCRTIEAIVCLICDFMQHLDRGCKFWRITGCLKKVWRTLKCQLKYLQKSQKLNVIKYEIRVKSSPYANVPVGLHVMLYWEYSQRSSEVLFVGAGNHVLMACNQRSGCTCHVVAFDTWNLTITFMTSNRLNFYLYIYSNI